MPADSLNPREEGPAGLAAAAADAADAQLVSAMRLVLATTVLLAWWVDPSNFQGGSLLWLMFGAYALHSLVLHGLALRQQPVALSKGVHWLDVVWYAVFVASTGGAASPLFLFFLFAILTASLRWGFKEGARVTLAATALFVLTASYPGAATDLPRLLLRSCFLLALGYISAYWGESKVALNRRLALLRDVSQLSNPRFGVDHTVTRVLEKIRDFFGASSCVMVLRDKESGACEMRVVREVRPGRRSQSVQAEALNPEAAAPLLAPAQSMLLFARSRWPLQRWASLQGYDPERSLWIERSDLQTGQTLADLLDGQAFMSSPLRLRRSQGHIFVMTQKKHPDRSDALFLGHIVAQAFAVIENIELVDRMASEAALQERRKIALDIHDRAVQPYMGLMLALSAVRKKAASDNPLNDDLDKLDEVTRDAIEDLRRYAGTFGSRGNAGITGIAGHAGSDEQAFTSALQEQVARIKTLYGVEISVHTDADLRINDRMKAEVLQMVREGLSNICRHTQAQHGHLQLKRHQGWLHVQIDNAATGTASVSFIPRSIAERAHALGGKLQVAQGHEGATSVQIALPL